MYINRHWHCAAEPAGAITATYVDSTIADVVGVVGTVAAVGRVAIFSLHRSTVKTHRLQCWDTDVVAAQILTFHPFPIKPHGIFIGKG